MTTKTKVIGTVAGATALALSGTGVAFASTGGAAAKPASTPAAATATATATATARHDHRVRHPRLRAEFRKVLRHTVHADLIVSTKNGYVTIDADRGTLQSDTSNVLTLVRPDGPSVTATITPKTHFYGLSATHLASGDKMIIVQSGGNALIVASKLPS